MLERPALVRGHKNTGASCPNSSLAREAATLSLVTCSASKRCVDPFGEIAFLLFPSWPAPAVSLPLQQDSRHHATTRHSAVQATAPQDQPANAEPPPRPEAKQWVVHAARQRCRWSSVTPTRPASTCIPTCTWSASRPIRRDADVISKHNSL
jgi:hypothetical protein